MEIFNNILGILFSNLTREEIFQEFGNIKKRIGNNIILEPKIEGLQGIGLVLSDDNISSISFVLKKAIPFNKLKELFTDYYCGYNHYDEMTVLSFVLHSNIMVIAKVNGYISSDEISNGEFSKFEIITK